MKKAKINLIVLMIFAILLLPLSIVHAADEGKLEASLSYDISMIQIDKTLRINIDISNFQNLDTSNPIALSAELSFDSNILDNPKITNGIGWSAMMNNNKIVLDSNSFENNSTIATITFNVKTSTDTEVKLSNIEILNDDNLNETINELTTGTIKLTTSEIIENTNDNVYNNNNQVESNTQNHAKPIENVEVNNSEINKYLNTSTNTTQKVATINTVQSKNTDTTTASGLLPNTGRSALIIILITSLSIFAIYAYIRQKRMFDNSQL